MTRPRLLDLFCGAGGAAMTVFDMGRMRHLDLLALYHELNPNSRPHAQLDIGRLSTGCLVNAILASATRT